MEYFQSTVIDEFTPSADGTKEENLGIRPISHLYINIKCLNNGTNTKATLAQILGALESVEILAGGKSIVSLNGADLYALNCVLLGHEPWQENVINTDNAVRHLTLVVPFGRRLFDPAECLPARPKGEYVVKLQYDIADTGYDGLILHVEQVELPGASPEAYLKYTTKTDTPSATGWQDLDLPTGNKYVGILLWGTTIPSGTSWTTTLDEVTLLADNSEVYIREASWETLHGALINRLSPANAWAEKFHMENLASDYTQNADTATEEQDDSDIANYAYIDFDPTGDGTFIYDTSGVGSFKLHYNAGDTNAFRVIPIELVTIATT